MDAKRRVIALLAILIVTGIFMLMAFYGYYQNLFFLLIIIYFIISSIFFNPNKRKKKVPAKKDREGWGSFDLGEDKKTTPVQEKPKDFAELFFGEREIMQSPKAAPKEKISENYSGFEDIEHMAKKTITKDWGTMLYERIQTNASNNKKITAKDFEDEDYYGGDYKSKETKLKDILKFPFKLR